MRIRNVIALSLILAGASSSTSAKAPAPSPGRSFFEPFDRIDERRWYISDGWTNGGHQGCTWRRDHIGIGQGMLFLKLDDKPDRLRPYGCAEIRTKDYLGYGLYEVRMRSVAGSGLNTAMFTYAGPPQVNVHDEIDFEFLGKTPNSVQLNYFVRGDGKHGSDAAAPGASTDFHIYAFDWSPGSIRWYVDGQLVRTSTDADRPSMPGQYFLSLWNGSSQLNNWLGSFSYKKGSPVVAAVDWIAFTRAGERCAFPQSLSCKK